MTATLPEWMTEGLCAQTDPEEFFPAKGGSTKAARATCKACDVRAKCLDAALTRPELYGIWGGLSERERRALRVTKEEAA
ncbi:WhiB family transcriptional regulator [Streptomyces sp. NPDC002812]|uniref:WhiB family transcriptional regulator n=1 Tax=Streptomyces sp. NPDC002812 TaxID=3154434 RepID=UPI00332AE0AC